MYRPSNARAVSIAALGVLLAPVDRLFEERVYPSRAVAARRTGRDDAATAAPADADLFAGGASTDDGVADAWSLGYAEGHAAASAAGGAELAALARIADALERQPRLDREQIAARLSAAVLALVRKVVGECTVPIKRFEARIARLTDLVADAAEPATLRLHPADLKRLAQSIPGRFTALPDTDVARGGVIVETRGGRVEDTPEIWLQALARALDSERLPPC